MAGELNVAVTALVVSLIALFIAMGQLLQQMFSTADGYRRCQESVIGPWAKKTRLVWRWSQFRFETRFTTPEIVLYSEKMRYLRHNSGPSAPAQRQPTLKNVVDLAQRELPIEIRDTVESSIKQARHNDSGDTVTWTSFLQQLYLLRANKVLPDEKSVVVTSFDSMDDSKIGIIYRERTWDLMPADMIRPMASTRLGTLFVLALRLGMKWENLDMNEGILRATGNGHALISTTIRGLGICFQYNHNPDADLLQFGTTDGPQGSEQREQVQSRSTDLMAFGFVPGSTKFGIPALPLAGGSAAETGRNIASILRYVGATNTTIRQTTDIGQLDAIQQPEGGFGSKSAFAINDTIALLSDFIPVRGTTAVRVNWPLQTGTALSAFLFWECREKLLILLKERMTGQTMQSRHLELVLSDLSKLESKYGDDFYCRWHKAIANDLFVAVNRKLEFLEDLRQIHDKTTVFFEQFQRHIPYTSLVAAHADLACETSWKAWDESDSLVKYWYRTIELYVDNLPSLIEHLKPKAVDSGIEEASVALRIEEAWWTLMLRGMAWRMSIWMNEGAKVIPSKYYYDQTPVYII